MLKILVCTLGHERRRDRAGGFTIIELLIVIVVMAILATISVVAYNGIQERAKNAVLLSAFDAYEKGLRLYHATHGKFPDPLEGEYTLYRFCLGTVYPAQDGFEEGNCHYVSASSFFTASVSSAINESLTSVMGTLPETSHLNPVTITQDSYFFGYRGIALEIFVSGSCPSGVCSTTPTGVVALQYVVEGDQGCARGEKRRPDTSSIEVTVCSLEFDL